MKPAIPEPRIKGILLKLALLITLLTLAAGQPLPEEPARQSSPPLHLTACIDERPWIPFTNPDATHPGEMQLLVARSITSLGSTITTTPLPWKRCLESVRTGKIDAMIGASDAALLQTIVVFPRTGGAIDAKSSLGTARLLLVKRRDDDKDWNGHGFVNINAPVVAVALGTEIVFDMVKKWGGIPDNGAKTDEQNLKKLLQKRVDFMAGYEFDLDRLIAKNAGAKIGERVTVLRPPLAETPYYLVFSKPFFQKNEAFAQKLWQAISVLRSRP